MTTILNVITDAVRTAFVLAGYDAELGRVSISNRPDLCEYQSNGAMAGAKQYHKKPMDIEIYRIHMGISIAALTRLFVMTMSVRDQPYHAQNTQKPQASSDENA